MASSTIDNYLDKLQEKFPDFSRRDLRHIIQHGWKQVFLVETFGADVTINHRDFKMYIGDLKGSALKHFSYYINKLLKKLRILYKRKRIPWDGYYYFALSESRYQQYMAQKKKRGRPRKHFDYGLVKMYLIKGECELEEHSYPYIFRLPYPMFNGYVLWKHLKTDKAEFLYRRDPMKFKDILVENNKYGIL